MSKIRLPYIHEYRDRKGRLWRYVRRRGLPQVRLPGLPGSPEFMEAYGHAIAGKSVALGRGQSTGSLASLVERYFRSVEFANLKPSSQAAYRIALSPHLERDGHRMAADIPQDKARKIVEEIGATRPGMANLTRSVFSAIFEFAIACGIRPDNPFKRVPIYRLGTRHTWTDDQLAAFEKRWPLGTRERLAYAVLLYTGQRVSDAVRFKRGATVLILTQQKTGTELTIPIHPALARAIKAGPSNGIYLTGDNRGRPLKSKLLTRLIRLAVQKAELPAECKAHGLRKANQRLLAEGGASAKQMQAVSGHRTLKETERYAAKANQTRLAIAAMAMMPDESGTGGG
jgi:integrase